jgi:polygalacturonase
MTRQIIRTTVLTTFVLLVGCSSHIKPDRSTPVFRITDYGAVGDGTTPNTDAFARAIDAASKAGGGTVLVTEGIFLTGPIALVSNITLKLENGATIKATDDLNAYGPPQRPGDDPLVDEFRPMVKPILYAENATDVAITGGGTIDGSGQKWWDRIRAMKAAGASSGKGGVPPGARPRLLLLRNCKRVHIAGVTLRNSPNFNIALYQCDDVLCDGLTITAPPDSPNTDGIDPGNCRNVTIRRCTIDVGDDNVSFKCVRTGRPMDGVLVEDCTFKHGHGASVGSALGSGIRNVTVRRCTFDGTTPAIRIKSARDRGALVENVVYRDITMKNVSAAIYVNLYYFDKAGAATRAAKPITDTTPIIRNVRIENVTASGAKTAGEITGLPEMPVSDVRMKNVTIEADKGFVVKDAKNVRMENVQIKAKEGDPLHVEHAEVIHP